METPKVDLPTFPEMPLRDEAAPEKVEAMPDEHELPPPPSQEEMIPEAPPMGAELPEAPKQEAVPEMPPTGEAAKPEFPAAPETPGAETIPGKIPPLEGMPEAPSFEEAKEDVVKMPGEPEGMPPMDIEKGMPETYLEPEEPAQVRRQARGPLYIKTQNFKTVIENIEHIRTKFKEEDDIVFRITDIKNSQDQSFEGFRQALEDMQRKLLFVDRMIFEANR